MLSVDKLVVFDPYNNSIQNKGARNVLQPEYTKMPTPDCPPLVLVLYRAESTITLGDH